MPLLPDGVAPCNWCIDTEMYRISDETGEPADVSKINLSEITKTAKFCIKCSLPFCVDHASPVDQSDCCVRCLPFEDISEMRTQLVSQDENGTHVHKGYRVVPTGAGYKTLPKAISLMSDGELDAFIVEKQNQINNVERQRNYLRIAHSTAKLERNERDTAELRALRGIKIKLPVADPAKGIKITGQKGNGALKGVAGAGGQQLDLAAFLKFAQEQINKKAVQAATNKVPPSASPASPLITAKQTKVAPEHVVEGSSNNASSVTAERGGDVATPTASPSSPSQNARLSPEEILEKSREAEIEAILGESEEKE